MLCVIDPRGEREDFELSEFHIIFYFYVDVLPRYGNNSLGWAI